MAKAAERTQVSQTQSAVLRQLGLTLTQPQRQLLELLKVPGNEICADCGARNPRWAAWDHGQSPKPIFTVVKAHAFSVH